MRKSMKVVLFILSLVGFVASVHQLIIELSGSYESDHLIYIFLLAVLMCNCVLGLAITYPEAFPGKRRLRIAHRRYAIKK